MDADRIAVQHMPPQCQSVPVQGNTGGPEVSIDMRAPRFYMPPHETTANSADNRITINSEATLAQANHPYTAVAIPASHAQVPSYQYGMSQII